jgi:hypothetical protein
VEREQAVGYGAATGDARDLAAAMLYRHGGCVPELAAAAAIGRSSRVFLLIGAICWK